MITALVAVASVIVAVWAGAIVLAVWRDHQAAAESSDSTEEQVTANIERVRPTVQPTVYIAPSPLLPTTGRHRRQTIGERHRPLWAVDSRDWPTSPAPRPALTGMAWATSCELWAVTP
jgi:hypothetical protein